MTIILLIINIHVLGRDCRRDNAWGDEISPFWFLVIGRTHQFGIGTSTGGYTLSYSMLYVVSDKGKVWATPPTKDSMPSELQVQAGVWHAGVSGSWAWSSPALPWAQVYKVPAMNRLTRSSSPWTRARLPEPTRALAARMIGTWAGCWSLLDPK